jgi:hypothetical protein
MPTAPAPKEPMPPGTQAFFEKVLVVQEDASNGDIRLEAEFRAPFDSLMEVS